MYPDHDSVRRPPSSGGYVSGGCAAGHQRHLTGRDEVWLSKVCEQLKRVDTYNRGLISGDAFAKALEAMGLEYGMPDVDAILEHCICTADGYVHYKPLVKLLAPEDPRAKQSVAKNAIFPRENGEDIRDGMSTLPDSVRSGGAGSLGAGTVLADDIRPIFAKWESGRFSNSQFKAELQKRGVNTTEALERLMLVHGASRAVPFGKILAALQIDENDGRRARNAHGCLPSSEMLPSFGGGPSVPVAFEFASASKDGKSLLRIPDHDVGRTSSGLSTPVEPDHCASLRRAVVDFIDGKILGVTFKSKLQQCGISVNPELDRLIRRHEGDGSVRFTDMARVLPLGGGSLSSAGAPLVHSPWDQVDSCARSEVSSVCADKVLPSAARTPVPPPFATQADVNARLSQEAAAPDRRPKRTTQAAPDGAGLAVGANRGGANSDIIGWTGQKESPAAPSTAQQHRKPGLVGDLLQTQSAPPTHESASHFGKRFYGQAPPAAQRAPFGRECDVRPPGSPPKPIKPPFGICM